ncbi:GAF domain-containing protein [Nocardia sp. NPDC052566]|uniref:GAF domain-containing protein n=1 Tax=Nocardia sp. NPDC052566 TaxID=3364330 RepID=UPI0037C9F697
MRFDIGRGEVIKGRWLLIETLGRAETWSVVAEGTAPREWKSFQRSVPSRLQPLVATAYTSGAIVDQQMPQSRHAWSGRRVQAVPVLGPDERVHAVKLWLGAGDPPPQTGVAPFVMDARTRLIETLPEGLGPGFPRGPVRWTGAESFAAIERFDAALEFTATIARSAPGSRWMGIATIRAAAGPRAILLATRNGETAATGEHWSGIAVDVTDTVAPQQKSFEATTIDLLRSAQPNLYIAIVDTAQLRLIRWVTEPVPGIRWGAGTDERTTPHPTDHTRILTARNEILTGAKQTTLAAIRFASTHDNWITADLEITPLPGGTPGATTPEFALVQIEVHNTPG